MPARNGAADGDKTEGDAEEILSDSAALTSVEAELRQQSDELSHARDAAEMEQERYWQLFEFAPDGYLVTNLDGVIQMVNQTAAKMLGIEPQYLLHKPLAVYIDPEQRRTFRKRLIQLRKSGANEHWVAQLHPRHLRDLSVMISVVRSFSPQMFTDELLWQLQDMTEYKLQEKIEREQFFRATFEQSPMGIGHTDQNGKWLRANVKLSRILGYSLDELKQVTIIDVMVPEDREISRELFRQIVTGERGTIEREKCFLHKSGAVIWAHIDVTAVRSASGEFLYNLVILDDISERKQVEAAEREQRVLAETLRDTALLLTSSLEFSEVIDHILLNIGRVVPHDAVSFLLIKDDSAYVARARGYGQQGESLEAKLQDFHISANESDRIEQMLRTHKPVWVRDWKEHGSWDQVPGMEEMRSLVAAPILTRSAVTGFLKLHSRTPNFFTEEHARLLQVFAAQAAIAIQNARAYQEAQSLAAQNERHRLARELHDAVTQTLFSANVIADSLPRLWTDIPEPVETQLQQLQLLTRGALAEMRTLLLELRPEYLANIDLESQLRQLLDAMLARKRIKAHLNAEVTCLIPASVRIAFYRIAQEALNNIVKHAHASVIRISLSAHEDCVQLAIHDDGVGFERHEQLAGFGLHTMNERAEEIGAELDVITHLGAGTSIRVIWGDSGEGVTQ